MILRISIGAVALILVLACAPRGVPDAQNAHPAEAPPAVEDGAGLYARYCAVCHGTNGEGHIGPRLTDDVWLYGGSPSDVRRSIAQGHAPKGMPAWSALLSDDQIQAVTAYVIERRAP